MFQFILGFENDSINALKLTAEVMMGNKGIIEDCQSTIINVLTAANITTKERRLLRRILAAFKSKGVDDSVLYIKAVDVKCPSIFNETISSCVLSEWMVLVEANPYEYEEDSVSAMIFDPIRDSTLSFEFLNMMNRSEVKDVMFVGDGPYDSEDGHERTIGTSSGRARLSSAALIGVLFFICFFALFMFWRKNRKHDREQAPDIVSGRESLSLP